MTACQQCGSTLRITELCCDACGVRLNGTFQRSRLARLEGEHQYLIEQFILCGGNLKQLAEQYGVSYPTLRKRFGEVQTALAALATADERQIDQWLDEVERGQRSPELVARHISELNGGSRD